MKNLFKTLVLVLVVSLASCGKSRPESLSIYSEAQLEKEGVYGTYTDEELKAEHEKQLDILVSLYEKAEGYKKAGDEVNAEKTQELWNKQHKFTCELGAIYNKRSYARDSITAAQRKAERDAKKRAKIDGILEEGSPVE
jgi:hypothetical protein